PTLITVEELQNLAYELSPDGQQFAKPVTISIKYDSVLLMDAGYSADDLLLLRNGRIFPSNVDMQSETLTANTLEFSMYVVVLKDSYVGYYPVACMASHDAIESIPHIMRDNKEWELASDLMDYWFAGEENRTENFYEVNLDQIKEIDPRISQYIEEMKSEARSNKLIKYKEFLFNALKTTKNSTGGMIIPDGGSFDHIETELSYVEKEWHDATWEKNHMFYIQTKGIDYSYPELLGLAEFSEFTAAFGRAVLRVVAKGEVTVDNNLARVTIDKVGIYFRDSYDFVDNELYIPTQPLGCWSTTSSPYVQLRPFSSGSTCVCNSTFRKYNISNGQLENSGNFRIFSDPEKETVDTNQSFEYIVDTKVDSVFPLQATLNQATIFTVKGQDLPSTLDLWIEGCENVEKLDGENSRTMLFRCTPSWTLGKKNAVLKDTPGGTALKEFSITVTDLSSIQQKPDT
ncbi:MAG: hypothetical protein D3923_16305, partial [Candidatus Electrothrix sp. AR3]|nr:hypothetical protein [Candidatus Electrothrix sp. AR3]